MWPRSGTNGERLRAMRRTMIQNASMIGTASTSIATTTFATPMIESSASV